MNWLSVNLTEKAAGALLNQIRKVYLNRLRREAGFVVTRLIAELAGGDSGSGGSVGGDFEIGNYVECAGEDGERLFRKLVFFLRGLGIDHLTAFKGSGRFPRQ